jgi:hypothetical protein
MGLEVPTNQLYVQCYANPLQRGLPVSPFFDSDGFVRIADEFINSM